MHGAITAIAVAISVAIEGEFELLGGSGGRRSQGRSDAGDGGGGAAVGGGGVGVVEVLEVGVFLGFFFEFGDACGLWGVC